MNKTLKATVVTSFLLAGAILLQATVLEAVAIAGVKPDLSLVLLVFTAYQLGPMVGQIGGFAAGLVQDFVSLPPLGFHALIRTIIGFLYGRLQGRLLNAPVFVPILLVLTATVVKAVFGWLLAAALGLGAGMESTSGSRLLIELAYNGVAAPPLFAILGRIRLFQKEKKEWGP